jgi:hypothetical protein
MVQIKFVKEIPVINGTYKKDTPHGDIGYQKWKVTKTYEVTMIYEVVAKTKEEAEELFERKEDPKEEIDDYGHTFRETIKSKYYFDLSGDEPVEWKKIGECIPRNDEDMDNDYKPFLNYEDPDWSKEDFEWYKNEDGTNIKKEAHGSTNT